MTLIVGKYISNIFLQKYIIYKINFLAFRIFLTLVVLGAKPSVVNLQ